jgi:flagellar biosynthetic protein FlhB
MSDEAGEKKHEPGEKKWQDAAEKGNLPKSADIGATAVVMAGGLALVWASGPAVDAVRELLTGLLDPAGIGSLTMAEARTLQGAMMFALLKAMGPALGAVLVAGTIAGLAQTGMQLATSALEPKWDRLDAIQGAQNAYFSSTPFVELAKGTAKIGLLGAVVVLLCWDRLKALPKLATVPPVALLAELVDLGLDVLMASLPVMVAIAAGDYAYTWYKTNDQLMRTDKEMRDEAKESEGDPMLKAKRRQRARELSRGVNLAAVATADVVVTNPTHYAVALRYRREEDMAPVVLAMGVDHMAQQIKQKARESGVPQVENRTLARALYAKAEAGQAIPEALYKPVAKVLAAVMKRRKPKN